MINVERFGGGPDIYVGVHGWGGSHATFLPLVPLLPPSATLLAVDLPGYGRSPWQGAESASELAAPLAAFLDRLDPETAVTLIGNCSGAIIGMLAAEQTRVALSRCVFVDPFAFLPWYFKVFVQPGLGAVAYRSTFANPMGRWVTNLSLRNRRNAGTDLTASFRNVDHEASLRYLELLDGIDSAERFRGLTAPVDIAYGARTFAAVKTSIEIWRRLWPHARIHRLEGAGHLPIEEAPGELARIAFLSAGARVA